MSRGIASLQRKTERTLRTVSSSWISQAWSDLDVAFEAKDPEALRHAADECSAARGACAAAGTQSARPDAVMLDKLAASLRICDGSSSFGMEASRLMAFADVRRALARRLGEAAEDPSTSLSLSAALNAAASRGCLPGDAADDCVGRAQAFRRQLLERLPSRWGLWSSSLLSRAAVLWEASTCLARVQKAIAFSRTSGAPNAELEPATALEQLFGTLAAASAV
ncbi:unnamed protein product [Symbiodinium natans]|uniref:Uncharacterized protein n=1 Tax=Symbiodinium natans TaxID=878477 RepID=A0A812QYR5_9DINO|nr:unnamed protein product [Symbiodinium natans]